MPGTAPQRFSKTAAQTSSPNKEPSTMTKFIEGDCLADFRYRLRTPKTKQPQHGKRSLHQAQKHLQNLLDNEARPRQIKRATDKLKRVENGILSSRERLLTTTVRIDGDDPRTPMEQRAYATVQAGPGAAARIAEACAKYQQEHSNE
jgi:hypothetical protein